MNPAIIQAAAAERTREMYAAAAARQNAAEIRRSRRSQAGVRVRRGGRGYQVLRALRTA
jgi:hypothetical protein